MVMVRRDGGYVMVMVKKNICYFILIENNNWKNTLFAKLYHFLHLVTHTLLSAIFCDLCIQARIEAQSKTLRVLLKLRRRGDLRIVTPASMVISVVAFLLPCMNLLKIIQNLCINCAHIVHARRK
jgi:hypothetical protein